MLGKGCEWKGLSKVKCRLVFIPEGKYHSSSSQLTGFYGVWKRDDHTVPTGTRRGGEGDSFLNLVAVSAHMATRCYKSCQTLLNLGHLAQAEWIEDHVLSDCGWLQHIFGRQSCQKPRNTQNARITSSAQRLKKWKNQTV